MKISFKIIHLCFVLFLIGFLGRLVFEPYLPVKKVPVNECLTIQNEAGRMIAVFKVAVGKRTPGESVDNLISFDYTSSFSNLSERESAGVQRYIQTRSLGYAACDYESVKKALLKAGAFFWFPVTRIDAGFRQGGAIVWRPLGSFLFFPDGQRPRLEDYIFLVPEPMSFVHNEPGARSFFHDYFMDKPVLQVIRNLPSREVYFKVTFDMGSAS